MIRRLLVAGLILCGIPGGDAARAAGGAHVIDDAAVETPGTCHLENWLGGYGRGAGVFNSSPACTRRASPKIELGGFVTHSWSRGPDATVIGLSPKFVLRDEDTGVGVGIATSIGFGIDDRRAESASVIVPLTIPAGETVRLNVNVGGTWARDGGRHDLFVGAQAEIGIASNIGLMVEGFTRDSDKAGGQAGLRWTIAGGAIDLDMLAGRYLDGVTPSAITFGITLRR